MILMMIMGHHIPATQDGDENGDQAAAINLTGQERALIIALGLAILAFATALAGVAEPTQASTAVIATTQN